MQRIKNFFCKKSQPKTLDFTGRNIDGFVPKTSVFYDASAETTQHLVKHGFIHIGLVPTSIVNLHLANNNLECISENWFDSLVNLEFLDVSANKITSIDYKAFEKCKRLVKLNVSHNALKHVALNMVVHRNNTNLEYDFNDNMLVLFLLHIQQASVFTANIYLKSNMLKSIGIATNSTDTNKLPEFRVYCSPQTPPTTTTETRCRIIYISDTKNLRPPRKFFNYLNFTNFELASKPLSIVLTDAKMVNGFQESIYKFLDDYHSKIIKCDKTGDEYNELIEYNRHIGNLDISYSSSGQSVKINHMYVPIFLAGSNSALINPIQDKSVLDRFVFGLSPQIKSCSKEKYFATAVELFTASSVSQMTRAISNKLDMFNATLK